MPLFGFDARQELVAAERACFLDGEWLESGHAADCRIRPAAESVGIEFGAPGVRVQTCGPVAARDHAGGVGPARARAGGVGRPYDRMITW
ncbi:hypothetical protein Psi02_28020 [Planotetraspora silvatica]|uniref:Uncharacterized protein n=1 Tax=Planotetraspora silvatica TaxID=234614 RepID=A0A8J3UIJ5_9ACTN|nr:hypothetical protein Psi02_28020 [Planotetraspora silvatica]